MRLVTGIFGVALLAAMPAGGVLAQDQGAALLTAFQESCVPGARYYDKTTETIQATGWTKAEETANPELESMMKTVREQMQPEEGMELSGLDLYQKEVGGRPVYGLVIEITAGEFKLVSCYVYDFDATEDVSENALNDWLGMPATEVTDQPGLITSRGWQNAPNLQSVEVRTNFIPEGSPGQGMTGFSGIGLSVTGFTPGPGVPQ